MIPTQTTRSLPAQITFKAAGPWLTEKVVRWGESIDLWGQDFYITASGRKVRHIDVVIF